MTKALESLLQSRRGLVPKVPDQYRLYYDDEGKPLFYSSEDLPGRYIIVDQDTYNQGRYDLLVINGKIRSLSADTFRKLVPAETGTACHPTNVMIVDPSSNYYWKLKGYEN